MRSILTSILVMITVYLSGQNSFIHYYGREPLYNVASSVKQTPQGGYIICGRSSIEGSGTCDGYLIKTDATGDTLWTKLIGDIPVFYFRSFNYISTLSSGNYIIIGTISRFNAPLNLYESYMNFIKMNPNGDTLFSKTYYSIDLSWVTSVVKLPNEDFVATGGHYYHKTYICKIDSSGNLIWEKDCGTNLSFIGNSIDATLDGGFIISDDHGESPSSSYLDINLIKTNNQGDSLWTKCIPGPNDERGEAIIQTPDSGYMIAGWKQAWPGNSIAIIVKTDKNGNLSWEETFSTNEDDFFTRCKITTDGNYIFAGMKGPNVLFIKTDPSGNVLWQKIHPDNLFGYTLSDLQLTADGGYVLLGYRPDTLFTLTNDIFLIKTDSLATGFVDCPDLIITNGLEEETHTAEGTILVSPNPFSESTSITISSLDNTNNILIYNNLGQRVKDMIFPPTKQLSLNKNDLKPGIYFIQVRYNDKILGTIKVISF